jgi:VanZ family protein
MSGARRALGVVCAWLLVCAYTGLIWWLSAQNIAFKAIESVPLQDKGVHFVEYGVLGGLMAHAVRVSWPARRLGYLAAFWLTCGLGLVDELHQVYVPGRMGDARDLLADAIGAATATLGYALVVSLAARKGRRSAGRRGAA